MTIKQTTCYTDVAFAHAQALVDSGEFPNVSAAVSATLVRDKQRRAQELQLLRAELDRRMALPADQWEDWKPGHLSQRWKDNRA